MGTDISVILEVRQDDGKWYEPESYNVPNYDFQDSLDYSTFPFNYRSYGLFGFLANIRNMHNIPSITDHRGLPEDSIWLEQQTSDNNIFRETNRQEALDGHYGHTWVTLQELLDFAYDQVFEDRRSRNVLSNADNSVVIYSGSTMLKEGQGNMTNIRDFLGDFYFLQLEALKTFGEPSNVRLIMYFD